MIKKEKASRLEKLQKHWSKANEVERRQFLSAIGARSVDDGEAVIEPQNDANQQTMQHHLIATGRYLLPATRVRIEAVMVRRSIAPSDVMHEMGLSSDDLCLTRALARGSSLRLAVIAALTTWLTRNESAQDQS
jgi:hypothetical protein